MPQIPSLVHRTSTSANSLGPAPVDTSLEQRLLQAHQQAHDTHHDSMKPADMEKVICAIMMSQWKAQILSPDPDDPSACPTLQSNPSW
ncbi:hypothetical protein ACJ51O_37025 (plasmid) [Burkholderia pyrrocinia]|uniref:hypothetical protein n=1 Tax=Burkholderia pyrrocinia TaxID=60550 RepID=UPI0038B6144E